MGKINKIKEQVEMYKKHFLTLETETVKELLKQYEFERATGLGLNTTKIVTLKQVIKFRCCPECGEALTYDETGGCEADGTFEEWIECTSCEYSRELTNEDIDIIYGN